MSERMDFCEQQNMSAEYTTLKLKECNWTSKDSNGIVTSRHWKLVQAVKLLTNLKPRT